MKLLVAALLLHGVLSFLTDDIEFGPNLCDAPTCEYFHNFQRVLSMMYTDDDGQPHLAMGTPAGKVIIPELGDVNGDFIVQPADFNSHGLIVLDAFQRVVHTVNNMVPESTIEVMQDAEIIIHFINSNADGQQMAGIHWHGMYQTTTPWQDGVGGITQCHINPATTWTYKFRGDPWGSFWFHSHTGFDRDDGLFGAMIIHEREVPDAIPVYQHDHFFTHITEWFHDETEEHWLKHLTQEDIVAGRGDVFDSTIIYHAGLIPNGEIAMGQWFEPAGNGQGPLTNLFSDGFTDKFNTVEDVRSSFVFTTFNVVAGDIYRWRFIGASFNHLYRMSWDDHLVMLIAQDGFDIEPVLDVESILILPGERYDVLFSADQPVDNYWMRSISPADAYAFDAVQHEVRAVIHYDGAADPADDDFDPWTDQSPSQILSQRRICDGTQECLIGNCYQLEYFPPNMVDGNNDNCNLNGVCMGNGAITTCNHPGDNVNIDLYDQTRRDQFSLIGNDGTYVDVGLPVQPNADAIHFLGFAFDRFVNGIKWRANSEPLLFNFVIPDPDSSCPTDSNGDQFCPAMDCHCTHIVELEWDSVTDIVWFNLKISVTRCGDNPCDPLTLASNDPNNPICGSPVTQTECASDTSHPIHLHGHAFWILFEGKAELDPITGFPINNAFIDCDDDICMEPHYRDNVLPPLNFINPPQKDTLPVPPGSFAHARIKTNNPGYWPNHCHLENHLPTMMISWHENHSGDFNDPKNFDVNRPPTLPRCGNFDPDAPNGIGPQVPTTIPGETAIPGQQVPLTTAGFQASNALVPAVLILSGTCIAFFSLFLWSCIQLQKQQKQKKMELAAADYARMQQGQTA